MTCPIIGLRRWGPVPPGGPAGLVVPQTRKPSMQISVRLRAQSVWAFTINATSGALTLVAGAPYPSASGREHTPWAPPKVSGSAAPWVKWSTSMFPLAM